jgi:hypothetical protein
MKTPKSYGLDTRIEGPTPCPTLISRMRIPVSGELTKRSILSMSTNGALSEAAAAPVNANCPGAIRLSDSVTLRGSAPKGFEQVSEPRNRHRYRSLYFSAHWLRRRIGSGMTIAEFLRLIQSSGCSVLSDFAFVVNSAEQEFSWWFDNETAIDLLVFQHLTKAACSPARVFVHAGRPNHSQSVRSFG